MHVNAKVNADLNAKVKAPSCPESSEEPCEDAANRKPGQIIDQNGCLVWTCVPKQPYCCEPVSAMEVAVECSSDSELVQTLDPKTNCKIWTCAPKQPYCCGRPKQIKCKENSYSVEVYDPKTGCLVSACAPCPEFDEDLGMNMCCLIGFPCKQFNSLGCPQWGCCSSEIYPEYLDESATSK